MFLSKLPRNIHFGPAVNARGFYLRGRRGFFVFLRLSQLASVGRLLHFSARTAKEGLCGKTYWRRRHCRRISRNHRRQGQPINQPVPSSHCWPHGHPSSRHRFRRHRLDCGRLYRRRGRLHRSFGKSARRNCQISTYSEKGGTCS